MRLLRKFLHLFCYQMRYEQHEHELPKDSLQLFDPRDLDQPKNDGWHFW